MNDLSILTRPVRVMTDAEKRQLDAIVRDGARKRAEREAREAEEARRQAA